jgi:hypothetical protein
VGDLQRALLDRAQVFIVARGEVETVFLGRGSEQRQAANVVQQAAQISFFGMRIIEHARHIACDHGRAQGIFPERAQVDAAGVRKAVEGLEDRLADHQRLDHVGAERHQRLLEIGAARAAVVGRAVGHAEQLGGHAGVLADQGGEFGHAEVVGLQMLDQLDQDLRHGRQTGNE